MTLPNDRTFYAKYQRVSRSQLLSNIIMKRKKKRAASKGRRRRLVTKGQKGQGFLSSFKKIANNATVRQLGKTALKKAINYAPQLYNLGTSKIEKNSKKDFTTRHSCKLIKNFVTKYSE